MTGFFPLWKGLQHLRLFLCWEQIVTSSTSLSLSHIIPLKLTRNVHSVIQFSRWDSVGLLPPALTLYNRRVTSRIPRGGGGPKVKEYLFWEFCMALGYHFLSSCIFLGCEFENFVP